MKFQTIYRTDADYSKTWEKIRIHPLTSMVETSEKGHLNFKFRNSNSIVQLTATGHIIITWENEEEKNNLFPLLKDVLVTKEGLHAKIEPIHTTIYRIPYPLPRGFTISYCSDWTYYFGIHSHEWHSLALFIGIGIPLAIPVGAFILSKLNEANTQRDW